MIKEELKMNIDEKVNKENIKLFEKFGFNHIEDNNYTCVCCGKKTCLNSSTSIEGAYLVCSECVDDKFNGSWYDCKDWQNEMLEKEKKNGK